jgi:epoxide hydrolase-like predicted phosphatase
MIKAIAFDYGGVIRINDEDLFGKIAKYLNITREEFSKEYFSLNYLFGIQDKSYEDVMALIISKFNDSKEAKDYILDLTKENHSKYHLNNELINIIKDLKNRNYKIVLLSNNSIKLKEELIKDGIADLFDEIIISAEVGFQKPQPEFFEILFKKMKVRPEEVIFIDDTLKSLEGANQIGYIPILYKDNQSLKSDLLKILNLKEL